MSKLQQLVLGALATALIAVGVAAQTGTVQPPRDRPLVPHALAPTEEPASSPSPIETPSPSPVAEATQSGGNKHKKH